MRRQVNHARSTDILSVGPAGILPAGFFVNQARRPVAPQARCLCYEDFPKTTRNKLATVIIAAAEHKLAEPRPFPRGQFKACRRQRIAARVFFVVETTESKSVRHMSFEVSDCAAAFQFAPQQFCKNLEMTRTIDESRTRSSNGRQSNPHLIPVAN